MGGAEEEDNTGGGERDAGGHRWKRKKNAQKDRVGTQGRRVNQQDERQRERQADCSREREREE